MCGIAGLASLDGSPVSLSTVQAMTTALAHRGPDGEGVWHEDWAAVGHRRLAIIDPESGQQPMVSADGRYVLTYNGELYNFRELRVRLEAAGHLFRTRSDTEVVLCAYATWGPRCVERFRGMFAFAVVDRVERSVFLARDHFGIKPLFWTRQGDLLAFASELAALRRVPELRFDVAPQSVDEYLRLQYIPAPRTVYEDVFKLRPGHRMVMGPDTSEARPEQYWRFDFTAGGAARSERDWLEELAHIVDDSVRAHMISDVPFGAFLSGGVDSSLVVGSMARIAGQPVQTFCIGFSEAAYDERAYAEEVARHWGTDHHVEVVRPSALEILPDLVRHYGEPFGDSSCVPTYYLCRMARKRVPMVLSGDAGDELFAGYATYRGWHRWLQRSSMVWWKRGLYPVVSRLRPRRFPPRTPELAHWVMQILQTPDDVRSRLWRPELRRRLHPGLPPRLVEEFRDDLSPLRRVQRLDFTTYLPDSVLTKVDVASMMWGLEVRTPLLDLKVVEHAAAMPESIVVGLDDTGQLVGKLPLKRVLQRDLPAEFTERPKQGFTVPFERWLSPGGRLHDPVGRRLQDPTSPLRELFEPDQLIAVGRRGNHRVLWLLLVLDEWLRQHHEGPVPAGVPPQVGQPA